MNIIQRTALGFIAMCCVLVAGLVIANMLIHGSSAPKAAQHVPQQAKQAQPTSSSEHKAQVQYLRAQAKRDEQARIAELLAPPVTRCVYTDMGTGMLVSRCWQE